MDFPEDLKYNRSHEWAREDDGLVTIGISDYAQDQLGDVVFVELPAAGRKVAASEAVAVVESVKTASDIYSPADGEIVEVNTALESNPELLNEAPYGDGWMFKLRPSAPEALADMLDAAGYRAAIEEDS
ncbi:MAG: glycine cleavage system protein GcvH [Trueperaceae bacterium]